MKKIAIIPSDPLEAYKKKGTASWLQDYYNPLQFFNEVYLLSPMEIEMRKEFGMKIIPTLPKKFQNYLKKLKIDIVRAYGGYWACDMACMNKMNNIPVVVSVHDSRPEFLHNTIKNADIVFCVSKRVRKLVLSKFRNQNSVWLLPNRVNFEIMRPFPENTLTDLNQNYPFKYKILNIGRKVKGKNFGTVIKALKFLDKNYCLVAIGKDVDKYTKLAKNQGVLDQCFFIESIKNEELARYYSWADCLCNPSSIEGFGVIFIEALACGTVVVTSDIAPMNEFIKDKINGLLVKDYENPQALAEIIKIACTNQSIRSILKHNARNSVKKFEKKRIDTLEANYYKKILEMKQEGKFKVSFWKRIIWKYENFLWLNNTFLLIRLLLVFKQRIEVLFQKKERIMC